MNGTLFYYPLVIQETDLDTFGHVNNAAYLRLYEQARWDVITKNGFGLQKIRESGVGPTILEVKVTFLKELRARDEIVIESQSLPYERKVGRMIQKMVRGDEICSTAEYTFALYDVKQRKLVAPTPEWLKAVGLPS
ncbi:MAG: thioesterase family protein [Parachlamydia sp.]|nr:thioesterase family protein [Parachlamydia sp.]